MSWYPSDSKQLFPITGWCSLLSLFIQSNTAPEEVMCLELYQYSYKTYVRTSIGMRLLNVLCMSWTNECALSKCSTVGRRQSYRVTSSIPKNYTLKGMAHKSIFIIIISHRWRPVAATELPPQYHYLSLSTFNCYWSAGLAKFSINALPLAYQNLSK
jgi:hypothetical protein